MGSEGAGKPAPERKWMNKKEMAEAVMSSARGDYETPPELVSDLAQVFTWDLDVCADGPNVCQNYFDVDADGLAQEWHGLCWMNPPYGRRRHIDWWLEKACGESLAGRASTVALIPARTSTEWFFEWVVGKAQMIVFIRGRLKYLNPETGARHPAPFPSAFAVYDKRQVFNWREQLPKLCAYGWRAR